MIFKEIKTLKLYAGDAYEQVLKFQKNESPLDLTQYGTFTSQWRVSDDATDSIDIDVDASNASIGEIAIYINGDKTRKMLGAGVLDVQGSVGPTTIARFNTSTMQDVTRDE